MMSKCYLDANFLVAVFIPGHEFHKSSAILFAKLLISQNELLISPLGMDETWHKAWLTLQKQVPKEKRKSHSIFYSDLKHILDSLIKNSKTKFVQFSSNLDQGIINALENIKNHDMRPRNAFHLSIMQDLGVSDIVTIDSKFESIPGINRIPY